VLFPVYAQERVSLRGVIPCLMLKKRPP